MAADAPSVSILLPVYNEAGYLDKCMAGLTAQNYAGPVEIVIAEGHSNDGTPELIDNWKGELGPALRVVDNPARNQAIGLNLAAQAATGEILIRADGHSSYAPDYVSRSVDTLLGSDAVAVGGRQTAHSDSTVGAAAAAAMSSPLAIGPAPFRHADGIREVDTVYLGAYRRRDLLAIGGYRRLPSGVAEDADLYFRWRQAGKRILLDPAIRSTYEPRSTPVGILRQYFRYGRGKAEMLYLNGRLPSWRPLAPLGLVAGLAGLGAMAVASGPAWPFVALASAWGVLLAAVAATVAGSLLRRLLAAAVTALMHLSYGAGLAIGLMRGPGPVRSVRRRAPDS